MGVSAREGPAGRALQDRTLIRGGVCVAGELVIVRLRLGPFWNVCYIVGDRAAGEAVVIDPAWDVAAITERATTAGFRITTAIVTHAHHDHAHGLTELTRTTGARVHVHERDAADLRESYTGPVHELRHDDRVPVGGHELRVLHTPGHTAGSVSLLAGEALFTGDTLMVGAVGRFAPDPDSTAAMWHTVSAVLGELPDTAVIHPGHDSGPRPLSTLAAERAANPALSARTIEQFRQLTRR